MEGVALNTFNKIIPIEPRGDKRQSLCFCFSPTTYDQ